MILGSTAVRRPRGVVGWAVALLLAAFLTAPMSGALAQGAVKANPPPAEAAAQQAPTEKTAPEDAEPERLEVQRRIAAEKVEADRLAAREADALARFAKLEVADKEALLKTRPPKEITRVAYITTGLMFAILLAALIWCMFNLQRNVVTLVTTEKGPNGETAVQTLGRMPMGLPSGTVRSALAIMIVAIGLWMYVLSGLFGQDFETPEALTGILGMVLGFYFGTRTGTGDEVQEAYKQVAQVQMAAVEEKAELKKEVEAAHRETAVAQTAAAEADAQIAAAETPSLKASAEQHLAVTRRVLDLVGDTPPEGVVTPAAVASARQAAAAVEAALATGASDPAATKALADAVASLAGGASQGSSMLASAARAASPMLGQAGLAAASGPAAIAVLMGVGSRLGSAAFQRWRSRVLAAPVAAGLVEVGSVTLDDVRSALAKAPAFAQFAQQASDQGGLLKGLAEHALREGGADELWEKFGPAAETPVFDDRDALEGGLLEFQQAILADASRADVTEALAAEIAAALAAAKAPEFKVASLTPADIETLTAAATQGSLNPEQPEAARAAFDLLVMVVETAREKGVGLAKVLAEIAP